MCERREPNSCAWFPSVFTKCRRRQNRNRRKKFTQGSVCDPQRGLVISDRRAEDGGSFSWVIPRRFQRSRVSLHPPSDPDPLPPWQAGQGQGLGLQAPLFAPHVIVSFLSHLRTESSWTGVTFSWRGNPTLAEAERGEGQRNRGGGKVVPCEGWKSGKDRDQHPPPSEKCDQSQLIRSSQNLQSLGT